MEGKGANNLVFTKERYEQLVSDINDIKNGRRKKEARDYSLSKRYDVMQISNIDKLIYPVVEGNTTIRYYATKEEIFDILNEAHIDTGHGGRNRMYKEVQKKYKNITQEHMSLYLSICTSCLKKSSVPKKGVIVKPMVFRNMNSSSQVDLIDMQSQAEGEFKGILVYQDHLTKFVQLRATKSKLASEVAYHFQDIFCIFGAPAILQSDNGREFVNSIITELAAMWNRLKIVHGKPCHSQSQGSVEQANRDIEDILFS